MKHKRCLLLMLILCMVLSLLPAAVSATETSVEQQIIDACTYGKTVDISQFRLTATKLEALHQKLLLEGKLPWYTARNFTYQYNEGNGYMLEFTPKILDPDVYDRMLYEQKVAEILAACVHEGMSAWQIALSIHDYLVVNCVYDEALELNTGYDLLMKGSTVCTGYAALYQDLLLRCGIPCQQVRSDPMEHIWNLVQLDGKWYHVDVTWDDPTPDIKGLVRHEYFLRTDDEMSAGEEPHHDWETDITCTGTTYSNAFWTKVESQIIFTDVKTCYFIRAKDCQNSIYRRDIPSGKETRLYKEKAAYLNIGHGRYRYYHTGLSLWNDRLWFCTMDKVYSMTLKGKDVRKEYTYNTGANHRVLRGCYVTGDSIQMSATDHDGSAVPVTQAIKASGGHVHSYTQTITQPNCTQPGYTVSTCQCGVTAKGAPVVATGHDWQQISYDAPTFFSDGYAENRCGLCGETDGEYLPQIDLIQWLSENRKVVYVVAVVLIVLISSGKRKKA